MLVKRLIGTVGGAMVIAMAIAQITGLSISAQDSSPATVSVAAPAEEITADEFEVMIDVANVENLGGFQVVLAFDGDVLEPLSIAQTEFLGSSGREVLCNPPTITEAAIRFSCVTLRAEPAGVDGSGSLARVKFARDEGGVSPLTLSRVTLSQPDGTAIPVESTDSSVRLKKDGRSWMLLGVGIGAVAAVVVGGVSWVLWRRRSSPSVAPVDNRSI